MYKGGGAMPPRTHHVTVDPWKPLAEQPGVGHNRWHEGIPPILEVEEGDRVILDTLDALDGQIGPGMSAAEVASPTSGRCMR
jgi:formamidase